MPRRRPPAAFTLVEILVSTTVLALLVFLVTQLFNSALNVTALNGKLMDADEQARVLFDRMAVDFARMVKRADVDYYLKQSQGSPANAMQGNDQMAFYSEVPGYYSPSGTVAGATQSPVSLVAYRVNGDPNAENYLKVERLGKGLIWNGAAAPSPGPAANPPLPMLFLPVTLVATWPQATNNAADGDYELIGPQVFRLEYYYLLKGLASGPDPTSRLSDTPWDRRLGHTAVAGMQDVAAVAVAIAVLDPQSYEVLTRNQPAGGQPLGALGDFATHQLGDFPSTAAAAPAPTPGAMEANWQAAINTASTAGQAGLPAAVVKRMRVYHRYFYLNLP